MLPGLDEDLDRHLEDQLAKASGNGNGQVISPIDFAMDVWEISQVWWRRHNSGIASFRWQITAKESRKEAARRMRKQIDNFLSWEDKIYGVADPDFSKCALPPIEHTTPRLRVHRVPFSLPHLHCTKM